MECAVCEIRSSIGYCIECQKLLCETCSEHCAECNKLMCPDHVHETTHGRSLCNACYADRKARHQDKRRGHKRHRDDDDEDEVGGTGFDVLTGAAAESEEDRDARRRAFGRREPTQPWKLCVYIAALGFGIVVAMFIFPTLRRIPMGGQDYIPTPVVLMICPFVAIFWGVYGIVNIDFYKFRKHCGAGIALALVTAVLCIVAVATDPASRVEDIVVETQQRRDNMSEDQLQDWRQNTLEKYR